MLILSALANHYRLQKLGAVDQFVMMYGGLRGAVAFALVLLVDPHVVPHAHMFVTTTIAMIYWTVFVQVMDDLDKVKEYRQILRFRIDRFVARIECERTNDSDRLC